MLKAGGASLKDVVRVMVLLRHPKDFDAMNKVYATYFRKDPPARTVVKIGAHLPKALISIMMTAVLTDGKASHPVIEE
jgi:enamine deaminase RidA (YjgF/YER057c/UK114 family)